MHPNRLTSHFEVYSKTKQMVRSKYICDTPIINGGLNRVYNLTKINNAQSTFKLLKN